MRKHQEIVLFIFYSKEHVPQECIKSSKNMDKIKTWALLKKIANYQNKIRSNNNVPFSIISIIKKI